MSLASIQEKLKRLKMQRAREKEDTEELTDIIDHQTWVKRIEQMGNPANEWLGYTNYILHCVQFDTEQARTDFITKTYSKAMQAAASNGGPKCESYARLFVNYANFVSRVDEDDARSLFYWGRNNLRRHAIVHIYAAQFEFQNGHKDKCRKIFEKAFEINTQPRELLDIGHRNFLLGHKQLITDDDLTNYTGPPAQIVQKLNESRGMDISLDCSLGLTQGKHDHTGNTGDIISKCNVSQTARSSYRSDSTSSEDTAPLSVGLDDAFSRPSVSKAPPPSTMFTKSSIIKPPPARRELIVDKSEHHPDTETPLPPKGTESKSVDKPIKSTNQSPSEATVSFNFAEKRKRQGSGGLSDDCDTVPLAFDSNRGYYDRPLRSSHSTPDCKNASVISVTTRKRRFVGLPRRTLDTVRESSQKTYSQTSESDDHTQAEMLLPMPDLDSSRTQETPVDTFQMSKSNLSTSQAHSRQHTDTHSGTQRTLTEGQHKDEISPPKSHKEVEPVKQQPVLVEDKSPPHPPEPVSHQAPSVPPQPKLHPLPVPDPAPPATPAPKPVQQVAPHAPAPQATPRPTPHPTPIPPTNHSQTPRHHQQVPTNVEFTPSAKPVIMINGKMYTLLNCIGRGGTSAVHDVLDDHNNMRAVKIVDMRGADEATIESYLNEISLLGRLQKSDRVISMFDHEYDSRNSKLYVVMERGDVDLSSLFARNKRLNEIKIKYYWQEMLEAVKVLHTEGIIHTDLKPANFLLVAGHLKLIDFGIAKAIQQDMTSVTTDQQVGTLNYMSPEALALDYNNDEVDENGQLKRKLKIGYKSDVWSLGCILYRMVYGCTPFQSIRQPLKKMTAITNPKVEIKFPEILDRQLRHVLQICLIRDPLQRPSIDDLLRHRYLTKPANESPQPQPPSAQADILRLMKQFASASPGSFSLVQQNAQGILAKIQGAAASQENPAPSQQVKRNRPTVRSVARAPLAPVDPNEN